MVAFTRGLPEPGSVGYSFFLFFFGLVFGHIGRSAVILHVP